MGLNNKNQVEAYSQLDYSQEVHRAKIKGMEQYNWLQHGFFTGQSLYYGQDLLGGEFQA